MIRPKFCRGEVVAVRSDVSPEHNIDRTEVVSVSYGVLPNVGYVGWAYQTAHQPDQRKWYKEPSLKKLPPDNRLNWNDCVWQPHVETVAETESGEEE